MNNRNLFIIIAVVVVLGAVILLSSGQTNNTVNTNTPTQVPQAVSPTANPSPAGTEMTVTETNTGFTPQSLTVKTGTKVTWTNKSGDIVSINSDPHPQHTTYPALNLGRVTDGNSVSLVFDKPGIYDYHDHLNPERTGTIIVE